MSRDRCSSGQQFLLVLCVLAALTVLYLHYTYVLQLAVKCGDGLWDYFHIHHASLSAGCLSGCLHALTGADHLAALLPVIITQRYFTAGGYGMLWGLGHGCASAFVGYIGYTMKGLFVQTPASVLLNYRYVGDFIVALTVLVIGAMGVYENQHTSDSGKDVDESCKEHPVYHDSEQDIEAADLCTVPSDDDHRRRWNIRKSLLIVSSVFVNGVVLGVSWDGLPSLAPAMVLDDWQVTSFLIAYLVSTMCTMSFASGVIGELSFWLAYHSQISTLSNHLAQICSYAACAIGTGWLVVAVGKYVYAVTHHEPTNDNVFPGLSPNDNVLEDMDSTGSAWLCVASIVLVVAVICYSVSKDFHVQHWNLSSACGRLHHAASRWMGLRPSKHVEEVL